jgi:GT2 family glycosyltransferase
LIAPTIIDQDGANQTLLRSWSTPRSIVLNLLMNKTDRSNEGFDSKSHYVSGPCLLVSAKNFHAVGGFNERLFLYREEETLARRLCRAGVRCHLEHPTSIVHIGGVSTSQVFAFSFRQSIRSDILFSREHFTTPVSILITALWLIRLLIAALMVPFLKSGNRIRARLTCRICLASLTEPLLAWTDTPPKPPK